MYHTLTEKDTHESAVLGKGPSFRHKSEVLRVYRSVEIRQPIDVKGKHLRQVEGIVVQESMGQHWKILTVKGSYLFEY